MIFSAAGIFKDAQILQSRNVKLGGGLSVNQPCNLAGSRAYKTCRLLLAVPTAP